MLEDAETVKKLPECDGVVFVEQCGMSKYSALELEIERVKDLGEERCGVCGVGVENTNVRTGTLEPRG